MEFPRFASGAGFASLSDEALRAQRQIAKMEARVAAGRLDALTSGVDKLNEACHQMRHMQGATGLGCFRAATQTAMDPTGRDDDSALTAPSWSLPVAAAATILAVITIALAFRAVQDHIRQRNEERQRATDEVFAIERFVALKVSPS